MRKMAKANTWSFGFLYAFAQANPGVKTLSIQKNFKTDQVLTTWIAENYAFLTD